MKHTYTASNGISNFVIEEGNLGAAKDMSDFGGPNMWRLNVKTSDGRWEDVQWMGVHSIQRFFKTKLPVYNEPSKQQSKYKLA